MIHRITPQRHVLALAAALALASGCRTAAVPPGAPAVAAPSVIGPDTVPAGLRPGEHHVVLNGVRHWYRVAGRAPVGAPPVVFLHGGPGQGSAHFDALAGPYLEPLLRVVYFDQRSSGRSDRAADGDYAIATLVEDVEALRRALGVPRMALVGHSFGGLLALEYAAKYPAHVSHLVVAAGVWDFDLQCRLRLRRMAELRPEAYARVHGDTLTSTGARRSDCELEFQAFSGEERDRYNTALMFPDPAVEARIDSVNAARGIRNTGEISRALFGKGGLLRYRFSALDRLTMPVLVVAGRHDGAARPEGLRALAEALPNARFVEYERSGHFIYLDEPERFARDLAAFFRASPASRSRR